MIESNIITEHAEGIAARAGMTAVLQVLHERGMLDTAAGQWNPLLMAAKAGHTHTVRFLVSIMGAGFFK